MIEVMTERTVYILETPQGGKETYWDEGWAETAAAEAGFSWSGLGHDYDADGNRYLEYYATEADLDEGSSPHTASITTLEHESDEDYDSIAEDLAEGDTATYEDKRGKEVTVCKADLKGRTLAKYLEDNFAKRLIPYELTRDYILTP